MTQIEFFNIIMNGLKDFPETKLQEIISYYENRFSLEASSGKTESQIINEIGDPHLLVNQYRNGYLQNDLSKNFASNTESCNYNFYSNDTLKNNNNIDHDGESSDFHNSEDSSRINSNSNSTYNYEKYNNSSKNSNTKNHINTNAILRIGILILALTIFSPLITGIIGFIIGIFGLAISLFVSGVGLLIGGTFTNFVELPNLPLFISNFPFPVIVLFALGSIMISIVFIILFYYLGKWCLRILTDLYKKFKGEGGTF